MALSWHTIRKEAWFINSACYRGKRVWCRLASRNSGGAERAGSLNVENAAAGRLCCSSTKYDSNTTANQKQSTTNDANVRKSELQSPILTRGTNMLLHVSCDAWINTNCDRRLELGEIWPFSHADIPPSLPQTETLDY